jgi:hypothetical protein
MHPPPICEWLCYGRLSICQYSLVPSTHAGPKTTFQLLPDSRHLTWGQVCHLKQLLVLASAIILGVRVSHGSRPWFTVSNSRLPQPGKLGHCIPQRQGAQLWPQAVGCPLLPPMIQANSEGISTCLHARSGFQLQSHSHIAGWRSWPGISYCQIVRRLIPSEAQSLTKGRVWYWSVTICSSESVFSMYITTD